MWDAPFFPFLSPADRLRLLADEIRHVGPPPWLLTALDYLADDLEVSDTDSKPHPRNDAGPIAKGHGE
jgi:hypothetical protein